MSHDLSIYTPFLKGPRVCNTTKQGTPPSKWLHQASSTMKTKELSKQLRCKVVEKYRSGKLWTSHGAPLNSLFKNWKIMAPQQTCQERAAHQNSQTKQGGPYYYIIHVHSVSWCGWLPGWMHAVLRSSAAWLGCVSEDAWLSTFVSPKPVREL